eukprot:COSAG03_NODE_3590_length_1933_cov_35.680480_1_plen_126_part_00
MTGVAPRNLHTRKRRKERQREQQSEGESVSLGRLPPGGHLHARERQRDTERDTEGASRSRSPRRCSACPSARTCSRRYICYTLTHTETHRDAQTRREIQTERQHSHIDWGRNVITVSPLKNLSSW